MLEGSFWDMLKSLRITLSTSVPAAVGEAAVPAKIVLSELATIELALHKLAASKRSPSKLAVIELYTDEDGGIE